MISILQLSIPSKKSVDKTNSLFSKKKSAAYSTNFILIHLIHLILTPPWFQINPWRDLTMIWKLFGTSFCCSHGTCIKLNIGLSCKVLDPEHNRFFPMGTTRLLDKLRAYRRIYELRKCKTIKNSFNALVNFWLDYYLCSGLKRKLLTVTGRGSRARDL